MNLSELKKEIKLKSSEKKSNSSKRFFKTGVGQYGEGDCFLGVTVPEIRSLAKQALAFNLKDIKILLDSKWHEERLIALLILVYQYQKNCSDQKEIFDFYLRNTSRINNWDLVDTSADKIIGAYTYHQIKRTETKRLLNHLASSHDLWERRIAILTCFYYIRQNDFDFILMLTKKLIKDEHDLIHKALGWMLREMGKRNKKILVTFLDEYNEQMPRTMLRYAIEKFSVTERKKFLTIKGRKK